MHVACFVKDNPIRIFITLTDLFWQKVGHLQHTVLHKAFGFPLGFTKPVPQAAQTTSTCSHLQQDNQLWSQAQCPPRTGGEPCLTMVGQRPEVWASQAGCGSG